MSQWLCKAKMEEAEHENVKASPSEGWFYYISPSMPNNQFIVKTQALKKGETCPDCGSIMDKVGYGIFIGCGSCDYEVRWIYARYTFRWRGSCKASLSK